MGIRPERHCRSGPALPGALDQPVDSGSYIGSGWFPLAEASMDRYPDHGVRLNMELGGLARQRRIIVVVQTDSASRIPSPQSS